MFRTFLVLIAVVSSVSVCIAKDKPSAIDEGKRLLNDSGCLTCHYVAGEGGFVAPPLSGISKYRDAADIVSLLTNKTKKKEINKRRFPSPQDLMTHVCLEKEDAQRIATFLLSLPKDETITVKGHRETVSKQEAVSQQYFPLGSQFKPHKTSSKSKKGKRLFLKKGCIACHATGGRGGRIGPSLDGIGAHRSPEYIQRRIENGAIIMQCGSAYHPSKYSMPPSNLSRKQISSICEFLMTLLVKPNEN